MEEEENPYFMSEEEKHRFPVENQREGGRMFGELVRIIRDSCPELLGDAQSVKPCSEEEKQVDQKLYQEFLQKYELMLRER